MEYSLCATMDVSALNFICTYFTSIYLSQVNLVVPCWFNEKKNQFLRTCPMKFKFQESVAFEENSNLGIVLDLDCFNNRSWQWIDYSDKNSLFSANYIWLIASESNNTFTRFLSRMEDVNLNVTADVTFALFEKERATTYQIFNNAKVFGGVLNSSLNSKYVCSKDECKKTFQASKRTKYGERCLFKDLTLTMVSVVTSLINRKLHI